MAVPKIEKHPIYGYLAEFENQRANIYVCGNANTMAPGVRTALIQVFRMNSGTSTDGNTWLAGLRADGRFLEDIWGG